jgi:hypothetical protein
MEKYIHRVFGRWMEATSSTLYNVLLRSGSSRIPGSILSFKVRKIKMFVLNLSYFLLPVMPGLPLQETTI